MSIEEVVHPLMTERYKSWGAERGNREAFDYFSYISEKCQPEDALIFCGLLFPVFIEEEGGVFLDGRFDQENFRRWSKQLDGVISDIERLINHVHVYDVFSGCSDDVPEEVFDKLSKIIGFCWDIALKSKFPDRKFKIEVSNSDQDYGPVVTFFSLL